MRPAVLPLLTAILLLNHCPTVLAQKGAEKPAASVDRPTPPPTLLGDNFLGEWEWQNGDEVFHVSITRNTHWPVPYTTTNQTANVIVGAFSYTRNGTMVAQSAPVTLSGVDGLFFAAVQTRKMVMKFYDYSHKKSGQVVLQFPASSDDEITWTLYQIEESHYNNPAPPNFRVPTAVTLTRQ